MRLYMTIRLRRCAKALPNTKSSQSRKIAMFKTKQGFLKVFSGMHRIGDDDLDLYEVSIAFRE